MRNNGEYKAMELQRYYISKPECGPQVTRDNILWNGMSTPDLFQNEREMKQYKRNISILVGASLIALFVIGREKNEPKIHELVGTWISMSGTIYYGTSIATADSSVAYPLLSHVVLTIVFKEDNTGSITDLATKKWTLREVILPV